MASDKGEALSPFGRAYLAGLLEHARASTVFTTPTINGYKRYRSYSLAPDRAIWGRDNRGVMIRVLGGPGDAATRLENRIGEPAANPYLYMASQILSGLDGVDRKLDPGPSADTPYETKAALLPKSLREAVFALDDDPFFRQALGAEFVDYYVHIKNAEIERFQAEVSTGTPRIFRDVLRPRSLASLIVTANAATRTTNRTWHDRWSEPRHIHGHASALNPPTTGAGDESCPNRARRGWRGPRPITRPAVGGPFRLQLLRLDGADTRIEAAQPVDDFVTGQRRIADLAMLLAAFARGEDPRRHRRAQTSSRMAR